MEGGSADVPAKSRGRVLIVAGIAVIILAALFACALLLGLVGNSCNCGPFPRISATADGDAVVVTYSGVYSDREGAWFVKRLPEEERLLTGFRYDVTSSDGRVASQNLSAPGPGLDQSVRFDHAATAGGDHVIVTAWYSDGAATVVYDRYL